MVLKSKQKQQKLLLLIYSVFHILQLWNYKHHVQTIYSFHSSVHFSCSIVFNTLWPHGLQHTRLPCPSPTPRSCSNTRPWSWYAIQPSHSLLSPSPPDFNLAQHLGHLQWISSFHQVAKLWSFSFSINPSNEYSGQIFFRLTGYISLQTKGHSRVFSNTTVQNHQFFSIQPSLWSNSHIHTWLLEKL